MSPRILLIDHYDSFTHNLAHLIARVSGVMPRIVPHDAPMSIIRSEPFDGLVLSPGPGRPDCPDDFRCGVELIKTIEQPILGVCLGHQGLAYAYGARIVRAPEPIHGRPSLIHHDRKGLFNQIDNAFQAIRYHSLSIVQLPECLKVTAWSDDGVVMGIEHRKRPQFGIQFHPESIGTEHGEALITSFLETATHRPSPALVHAVPSSLDSNQAERTTAHINGQCQDLHVDTVEWRDPEAVFVSLFSTSEHAFWLDTTRTDPRRGRFSYMGATGGPLSRVVRYSLHARCLEIEENGRVQSVDVDDIFSWLSRDMSGRISAQISTDFDFQGGYVGYLGYELKGQTEGRSVHASSTPDAMFIFADRFLVFDHLEQAVHIVTLCDEKSSWIQWEWREKTARHVSKISGVRRPHPVNLNFELPHSDDEYLDRIARGLEQIQAGESYEICLTTHLIGPAIANPLDAYRTLRAAHDVPFAAYMCSNDIAIASVSPERFLRIGADGWIDAHPIKGTAARGQTPEADRRQAELLRSSVKDRSENLMIVDLLRNDLSRVCRPGSVHVPQLMSIESYAVHQLVSEIRGKLAPGYTSIDAVRHAFPGGSMTGAPKRRTMAILDTLETEARGVYSGALGYFSVDGAVDMSIVIRTAVMTETDTRVGVGGAIVALSDPDQELAEIYLKGHTVTDVFSD